MLAIVRPSDWEAPLFLHVLGAMVLVGAVMATVIALLSAWRRSANEEESLSLTRLGFGTLLFVGMPAYLVMRIAGQWLVAEEDIGISFGDEPAWLLTGYVAADPGAGFLVGALGLMFLVLKRPMGRRVLFTKLAGVSASLLLVAYLVALWAMTTKPT